MAVAKERLHEMGADESGAAGDKKMHGRKGPADRPAGGVIYSM
jgi:hypothetical protein